MNTSEEFSVLDPMLPPADDVYVMPATQGQIRFWSLDQMHPGNPALEYAAHVAMPRQVKRRSAGDGIHSGRATS